MEARPEPGKSAASWPAIIAGAFVATSVSLVLLALGAGLGLAEVPPWPLHGISVSAFAVGTAIWFIVVQWISAAFGGYIAGRLRNRWHGTHPHEVFFRDTAHGLVTWAVATVIVTILIATSLFSVMGGGAHAAARAVNAVDAYAVDKLFRAADPASAGPTAGQAQAAGDAHEEAGRIVTKAWSTGTVPDTDRSYLTELVAARTGLSSTDAQKRVAEFVSGAFDARLKLQADTAAAARAAAQAAIYTALSMLVGAFIASVSAVVGGRLRDEHL
ncbi:MAG: hypothetical protein ABJC66_06815 [Gammaproteobacteria bacterium]